jgi:predicted ATP-dependent protease
MAYQNERIGQMKQEIDQGYWVIAKQEQDISTYSNFIDLQKKEIERKGLDLKSISLLLNQTNNKVNALVLDSESKEGLIFSQKNRISILDKEVAAKNSEISLLKSDVVQLQNKLDSITNSVWSSNKSLYEENPQRLSIMEMVTTKRVNVNYYGLGLTEKNKGLVFPIVVEVIGPGSGHVSVDVGRAQYESSFQDAVRTAAKVASDYTGISTADKDIVVRFVQDINSGVMKVDGPSAGAAITSMIIAGLTNRSMDSSILITGTIAPSGSIGNIGGLSEKLQSAIEFGAKAIMVPQFQQSHSDKIQIIGVSDIKDAIDRLLL